MGWWEFLTGYETSNFSNMTLICGFSRKITDNGTSPVSVSTASCLRNMDHSTGSVLHFECKNI